MPVCFLFFLLFVSCEINDTGKLRVFVSILPQKYFVERIGGELVDVAVMVAPGMNPSSYDPLPGQMSALAAAEMYFRIGVPFEDVWISRIKRNYPNLAIIDTRKNITLRRMETVHTITEQTRPDSLSADSVAVYTHLAIEQEHDDHTHTHESGRYDPHIWLNPDFVKIQAETICDALCDAAPAHEREFRKNLEAFHSELDRLSNDITTELSGITNKSMLVFHPAWGYFTDRFGLKQIPVEIEGKEPGPAQLAAIIDFARRENIDIIVVQSQFSTRLAETIASEINGTVLQIDPLAEHYSKNLREAAKAIASALE